MKAWLVILCALMGGCSLVPHAIRADMVFFEYAVFGRVQPWGDTGDYKPEDECE
ncbi:MAG: hypothetical protein QM496_13850 [Verrucomicrobiota bacterium]